jgi:hypothetical protein
MASNADKITDAMMGDPNMPVRSIKELISDRSLERKLDFDDTGDASIPDFAQLTQASSSSSPIDESVVLMGKKKQRQAERRANAIKAKEDDEDQKSFLSSIPFIQNEKGEVSPIKILESGGKCLVFCAWL